MLLMSIIVQISSVHTYTVFIYLISFIIPQNHFQFRSQHLFGTEMVFTHNHHFNWESYFDPPETVFNFGVTARDSEKQFMKQFFSTTGRREK